MENLVCHSKELLRAPLNLPAICQKGIYIETGEMGNKLGSSSECPFTLNSLSDERAQPSPTWGACTLNRMCFGSFRILSCNVYMNLENLWTKESNALVS